MWDIVGDNDTSEGDGVSARLLCLSGDVVATWQSACGGMVLVEAQWLYSRFDFSCRVMVGAAVWCCNEAVWVEVPIQPTAVCFCSHSLACHCGCLTLLERLLFAMLFCLV